MMRKKFKSKCVALKVSSVSREMYLDERRSKCRQIPSNIIAAKLDFQEHIRFHVGPKGKSKEKDQRNHWMVEPVVLLVLGLIALAGSHLYLASHLSGCTCTAVS
jgi:hypothetical protein